jgi:hypothetical protein
MSLKEKKEFISKLLDEALIVTDDKHLEVILESVIQEIYSVRYPIRQYPLISKAVDLFVQDFVNQYSQKNASQPIDREFILLSKAGLIALIDFSIE